MERVRLQGVLFLTNGRPPGRFDNTLRGILGTGQKRERPSPKDITTLWWLASPRAQERPRKESVAVCGWGSP